jgi:predicted nucleic acid-binding protein
MIAADTSTWIAYLEGERGEDVGRLDRALEERRALMVPAVLTELLSDPGLPAEAAEGLRGIPLIEVRAGYWERAGVLQAKVLGRGRKARLGDALIAQSCLDRGIALLTRDGDFQGFAEAAGLEAVIG